MNVTPCIVRDFETRDVAPANALTNWFIAQTPVHFGTKEATDEAFGAYWESGRVRYPWLTAEVSGQFAGYAKAGPFRDREAYGRTAETGIYVTDSIRRKGVGRALYRELLARLALARFHMAVAGITLPNDASVRLHEAMGFRLVGVFHDVGQKLGAWHDVGFWEIALPEPRPEPDPDPSASRGAGKFV